MDKLDAIAVANYLESNYDQFISWLTANGYNEAETFANEQIDALQVLGQ